MLGPILKAKQLESKGLLTVHHFQVWSDIAKEQTLQAARAAGLDENYAKIVLVSEPEAAAVHCLKVFKETENSLKVCQLKINSCIHFGFDKLRPGRGRVRHCRLWWWNSGKILSLVHLGSIFKNSFSPRT